MQSITIIQYPTRSAQSTYVKISKTSHVNHDIVFICIEACLAQRKVSLHGASLVCLPSSAAMTSSPCGRPPATTDIHVMTCIFY
jgi:hypothetical protein